MFLFWINQCFSQDWAISNIRSRQRVDLRDLGYPMVNEVPANSSAITSLIQSREGKIYGATSGDNSYLFLFDPKINKVRHLGKIRSEEAVHHSLVNDKNGFIYVGTGRDMFREIAISKENLTEHIDQSLWKDIKEHFKDYPGGHLYRYLPSKSDDRVKLPDEECELDDLGIPVAHNSVYALTINPAGDEIYGISYPDGVFFIYNILNKHFSNLGSIDDKIVFHGPERSWRSLPRALVSDDSGRIYTSSTDGVIKFYDPHQKKIISTNLKIPSDNYYLQFYEDYAVVECFSGCTDGIIYGGTSDGYLFSLNVRAMVLLNLGKVRSSRRLRCLATGHDGKIYLMAGERSASRPCQFYCYDPVSGGFDDLGLLIADRSPYYYWRGQQFDCMITADDGTIYIGESERRSHLFLYIPQEIKTSK